MPRLALLATMLMAPAAAAGAQAAPAPQSTVGQVAFANSGDPAAQAAFQRSVALLHNFEYSRAIAAFQEAQKADPGFVMAYWGEAMAHNHPVWMEQDAAQARAVLAKLGPNRADRLAKARTERERGFLEAVELLYGDGTKPDRDRAYSARMEALHRAFPNDVDAAAFYALSLLGLAHDGRDYGLYMRSAATLEEFFPRHSRHPGVLHYLIHSYDDPTHAPLGLRAARLYGAVAPDAPHALHMTSHIFIALGDWQQVVDANVAATKAVNQLRALEHKPPALCGHYLEWDYYARYQLGQRAEADAIRRGCHSAAAREQAGSRSDGPPVLRSYADMLVRSIVETGKRPEEAKIRPDPATHPRESFMFAYADLLAAGGDGAAVSAAYQRLRGAAARIEGSLAGPERKKVAIILAQAKSLEALRSGRSEEGLAELRKAAEIERSVPAEYGPPLVEKPSFEMLGEEYLRLGRSSEAAEAFRTALALAPRRRLSQAGLRLAEGLSPGSVAETASAAPHKH